MTPRSILCPLKGYKRMHHQQSAACSGIAPWMVRVCSNDNISVVFSRADFNSAVASGWKRFHLPDDRIWSVLVDTIRSNTVPTTERCSAEHAAISTDQGTMGGQSTQNADGGGCPTMGNSYHRTNPRGAVSMTHLSFWSPTTGTIGRCARRFCSHGMPGSSGT